LCGKTLLLRYIEQDLAIKLGWVCIYIDLETIRASTQGAFFADLMRLISERLSELSGLEVTRSFDPNITSAVFRGFLVDCLDAIGQDLILIIDPLHSLPTDLVQALLTSLRALYMDQQTMDHQVIAVVCGALSLATLTVGESSPFRGIARRVFVGDLSESASEALIQEFLAEQGVEATNKALRRLLEATQGDIYLIRWISQRGAELAQARSVNRLRIRDITHVLNRFLRDDVLEYAPLLEAIRLIEEDPDLLQCILLLLRQPCVPRSELPLPLSPDLDPLFLTGVVEIVDSDYYRIQNWIYHKFLAQHFASARVGHVLTMAGRWDLAIDFLEASILQGEQQARSDILPATINSIYASQDLSQAVHFFRRALAVAFGIREVQIWQSSPHDNTLRVIGQADMLMDQSLWNNMQIPISADRLEARAYRQQVPLRGQEGEHKVVRAIPLNIPGRKPFGVVTIHDELETTQYTDMLERDLQLVGFLNMASRALQAVSIRRQELVLAGRMQASLLPNTRPELPGWQITAYWKPARETSGDFYDFIQLPDNRLGLLVADVVDKGMGAALLMALTRTLIRTYAADYPDEPEMLLQIANQRLITDVESGQFVSLFYGVLDPKNGWLVYCNAGHPPPFIFSRQMNSIQALHRSGTPIGIEEDALWGRESARIDPGSMLLLYTDGIIDAQNSENDFFGQERLIHIARSRLGYPAQQAQDTILDSVFAFSGNTPQIDDITLMVVIRNE
jgi:serine phosphatase RsbU (regulator of sigma subunit)